MPISKKTAPSAAERFIAGVVHKPNIVNTEQEIKNQSEEAAEVVIPKRPRTNAIKTRKADTRSQRERAETKKGEEENDADKIKISYYATKEQHFQLQLYALQNNTKMTAIVSTLVEDFLKKKAKE